MPIMPPFCTQPAVERVLALRAAETVAPADTRPAAERTALLRFCLGGDRFCFPAATLHSVQPLKQYTPLPATPAWFLGVVDVRGRDIAVIDLRPLVQLPVCTPPAGAMLVLISTDETEIALLADEVLGIEYPE
jgi:chemotaxis signal transduction protein